MPPVLDDDWAANVAEGCVLDVPDESVDAYRSAPYWKNFEVIKGHSASMENVVFEDVRLKSGPGALNINSPYAVRVYDTTSRLLGEGRELSLTLPTGIYLVSAKGYSRKVAVK